MVQAEKNRLGDLLKYELDKEFCREVVTIASGQNLKIGAILGVSGGKYTAALTPASEGVDGATISGGVISITGGTVESSTEDEVTTTTITGGTIEVTGGTITENAGGICASAVLLEDCDASQADKKAVVLKRQGIVSEGGIVYPADATTDDKAKYKKELEKVGILIKKAA